MSTLNRSLKHFKLFKIEMENQAGTARIDRIIENVIGMYIILPGMKFEVISSAYEPASNNSSIFTIKMKDKRSKEIKMIEIVHNLYETLINSSTFFKYYN